MFRDKEILHQVLNVKASIHQLDLAVKEIHCKVFQKIHPKYDHEINGSCISKCKSCEQPIQVILDEVRELKSQIKEILGDDEVADLSSQMRYLTNALNTIQGEISGASHLSMRLHQRAEDNEHQFKATQQMINELKGIVSMARACLNIEKDTNKFNQLMSYIKGIEERYAQKVSSISIKIDKIFNWINQENVMKESGYNKSKPKKDPPK